MLKKYQDIQRLIVSLTLVIYPVAVLSIPNINGLLTGFMALAGMYYLLKYPQLYIDRTHDESLTFLAMAAFFSVTLAVTLKSGISYGATGKFIHLLLFIPVYIYLRQTGVQLFYLWYGLVAGSMFTAAVAIYGVVFEGSPRAMSITHPIIFGDLSLLMGCMSMAGLGWFRDRASWQMIFPVISLLSAMLSTILAVARGAWIAVPFLLIIFFWYFKSHLSLKQKISLSALLIVFFSAIYLIPQTGVSYHIDRTANSINEYLESDITSEKRATSVGSRFEMWQAAWKMYTDNPVFGIGWRHYNEQAKKQVANGERNKVIASYPHPHNQYLSVLASGGTLSFIFLMYLFILPIWLFVKYINHAKSADIRRLAFAGLILVVSYMIFGVSEVVFERSRPVNFFSFYLAIFFAAIATQNKKTHFSEHE